MANDERARKSSDTRTASAPSKTSSDTVVDWLSVYAQVYRETLTPELIVAYQMSLADVDPAILHRAFQRAMKASTFRPTPAEVLQAVAVEFENAPRPKQLEPPPMSGEERAEVEKAFDQLREKLRIPARSYVDEDARRRELAMQADQVLKKHGRVK